jgi:hypothetical protein
MSPIHVATERQPLYQGITRTPPMLLPRYVAGTSVDACACHHDQLGFYRQL